MVSESAIPLPRYQRLVAGVVLPVRVAGDAALDFCNTRAGWGDAAPRDYVTSYDDLVAWSSDAGLVDTDAADGLRRKATARPAEARRALERALALRDAVYATCTGAAAAAWHTVADEARAAATAAVLVPDAPAGRRWVIPDSVGLDLPTLEIARAAGTLVSSTDLATVRRCPGDGCGWLFVDARGRRRWCSMAVCGNRAKVRAHARRTRRENA